jgi:dTDP-4-dehydrorhamnose 3,5-epimerase
MYDDPDIGIEWPYELIGGRDKLIISEKDLRLMSFRQYTELMLNPGSGAGQEG